MWIEIVVIVQFVCIVLCFSSHGHHQAAMHVYTVRCLSIFFFCLQVKYFYTNWMMYVYSHQTLNFNHVGFPVIQETLLVSGIVSNLFKGATQTISERKLIFDNLTCILWFIWYICNTEDKVCEFLVKFVVEVVILSSQVLCEPGSFHVKSTSLAWWPK